jgi:hypothetical protein
MAGGVFNNPHAVSCGDIGVCGGPANIGAGMALIIQDLMIVIGSLAVIFIIAGGLQMAISAGDAKKVETARNTMIYACVGLVIAISAYAIVSFLTGKIK